MSIMFIECSFCLLTSCSRFFRMNPYNEGRRAVCLNLLFFIFFLHLVKSGTGTYEWHGALRGRAQHCAEDPSMPGTLVGDEKCNVETNCRFGGVCRQHHGKSGFSSASSFSAEKLGETCHCAMHCNHHLASPSFNFDQSFVCGSDGRTYITECHMRLAACRCQSPIKPVWRGSCEGGPRATKPAPPLDSEASSSGRDEGSGSGDWGVCGENNICRFGAVCDADAEDGPCLCKHDCLGTAPHTVCGTDGRSYYNHCYLKDAACQQQQEIEVDYDGPCKSTSDRAVIESSGANTDEVDVEDTEQRYSSGDGNNREKVRRDPCDGIICLHGVCIPVGHEFECSCEETCNEAAQSPIPLYADLWTNQRNSLAKFEKETRRRMAMAYPQFRERLQNDERRQRLRGRNFRSSRLRPKTTSAPVSTYPVEEVNLDEIWFSNADKRQAKQLMFDGLKSRKWWERRRGRRTRRNRRSPRFPPPRPLRTVLIKETVCGTDGKTYKNECELRVHACFEKKHTKVSKRGVCPYPYIQKPVYVKGVATTQIPTPDKGSQVAQSNSSDTAKRSPQEQRGANESFGAKPQLDQSEGSRNNNATQEPKKREELDTEQTFTTPSSQRDKVSPLSTTPEFGMNGATEKQPKAVVSDLTNPVPDHRETLRRVWVLVLSGILQVTILVLVASFIRRRARKNAKKRRAASEPKKGGVRTPEAASVCASQPDPTEHDRLQPEV